MYLLFGGAVFKPGVGPDNYMDSFGSVSSFHSGKCQYIK